MGRETFVHNLISEWRTASDLRIAAVLFERLPVVVEKINPVVYAFEEFS